MTHSTFSSSTKAASPADLQRRDLLAYESILRADLARLLPFEAHALYFPTADEVPAPLWISEEHKLLLPLRRNNCLLGVMLVRNPAPDAVASLLPHLPGLAALCMDKLALYKISRTDPLTGLATREVLLERLAREVRGIRQSFAAEPEWDAEGESPHATGQDDSPRQASLGLVVLRFGDLRTISRAHGHAFAEQLLAQLASALQEVLPQEALAARTGDAEFAVALPGGTPHALESTAYAMVRALENVRPNYPLPGSAVRLFARAGYSLFPQDWTSGATRRSDAEQDMEEAARLFDKARLASLRAGDLGEDQSVLGYGVILPQGGVIDQVLPLLRVRTTLGRDVGAREGQRFSVWSMDYPVQGATADTPREPLYKGEIVLAHVREDTSQAEIILQGDPAWPLAPGDRLALLPEEYTGQTSTENSDGRADPLTGLYRHSDFLARLAVAREKYPAFGVILFRFQLPSLDAEGRPLPVEHSMAEATACLRHLLAKPGLISAEDGGEAEYFAGRYSLNSILLFHPGLTATKAAQCYPHISQELHKELNVSVAAGVACLPWLSFRAGDALECCRKALEYGLLLPAPHVGIFDSLAMTISADKRYSQGDIFGAMEEYRLALLADEHNALAWNSLGVALADVGRHAESRNAFEQAVRHDPADASARYNLGTACVTLGENESAAEHFCACLTLQAGHLFAHIRLGELAETRQKPAEARQHYEDAQKADPTSPQPHRCLARLELRQGKPDKARERLHQALLRHPQDPFSLHLLARLYLDGGEDAELAESLARQSVALRPDRKAAWLELARALEAQGRTKEAREARVKAAEL